MIYEKVCIITLVANAAIPANSIGKAVTVARSGTSGRAALTTGPAHPVVGVLAEDGAFAIGDSVPVATLTGKIPVRVGAAVQAGQVAVLRADGSFGGAAQLANIPDDAMGMGVYLEDIAADGIGQLLASPVSKG